MSKKSKGPATTRRTLLGGSAATLGLTALGAACGPGEEIAPPPVPTPDDRLPEVPDGSIAVAGVRRADKEEAVRRAIELAGGIDEIQPGDTVFIKPNVVHGSTEGRPGIVPDLEILQATIRIVRERAPGRIIVGDRSARVQRSDYAFENSGIQAAAESAGADEVFPAPTSMDAPEEWTLVQPEGWETTWEADGGILAMRKILEADHLVNLAVCKNHEWAVYSLAMKNLIGAIGDESRNPLHYRPQEDPELLCRDIALLNRAFNPLINLVDAHTILLNGGPAGADSDTVRATPGLMLASKDRVAVDGLGAALIQHSLADAVVPLPDTSQPFLREDRTWSLPQMRYGAQLGIGAPNADAVTLLLDGLDPTLRDDLEARYRA